MNKAQITRLEGFVESLSVLLLRVYSQFLFVRPMMVNTTLIARFGGSSRTARFEQLRDVLYWTLILELVKLCDDRDVRTPSISRVLALLNDSDIVRFLERRFSRWVLPKVPGESTGERRRVQEQEEKQSRLRFRKTYARLRKNSHALLDSPALKGFKMIRSKLIAHNELSFEVGRYELFKISVLKLKYGDERKLLEQAKKS